MSVSGILFSQNISGDSLKITLSTEIKKGVLIQEIHIPLINSDTLIKKQVDVKATHWDTIAFNPYTDFVIKFPFKIEFNDSVYASPLHNKSKVITSRYGWRRGRPHKGIDIDLVTGDTVVAILDGVVRFARYNSGHGKTVVVRHYNGLETAYTHLSDYAVKANDTVFKGQLIAKGGNTGRSTGSHLHFIASFNGHYINPEYLFEFNEDNKIRTKEVWVTKQWTRTAFHNSRKKSKIELLTSEKQALASLVKTKKIYVVKSGDTLSHISKKNNVSIAAILKTNKIRKSSTLKIGQKLILEM